ncbi:MAG: hypothetical protein R2824_01840 [Saprospiraceae bacterium]|nr:hypothetical protein [Lewinella sp.]
MLMLFPKITVPGVPGIDFYRDSDEPDHFYAIRSTPKIAVDQNDKPMLSFLFFARNAKIAYASSENKDLVESQLGQLLLTVDLGLTEEEHEKAVTYLNEVLKDEQHPFVWLYEKMTKKSLPEPNAKIALPQWQKGTASLQVLEGLPNTFKKHSSTQVQPSLVGAQAAAFGVTLGTEGSQLFYDAFTKGYSGNDEEDAGIVPLQVIASYTGQSFALIPSIEIKVRASSVEIYRFLKTQWEYYRKQYETEQRTKWSFLWGLIEEKETVRTGVSVTKTDINRMVEEMWENKVIDIEITDYSALDLSNEETREVNNQIKQTMLNLITQTLIPNFFETAMVFNGNQDQGESDDDSGDNFDENEGLSADDRNLENQVQSYYFSESKDATKVSNLSIHIKEDRAIPFNLNPNGTIAVQLTEQERKDLIKYVDVSSPLVQILEVQVGVNADFVNDDIHSIIVHLDYKQKDHESGVVRQEAETFEFRTGEENYTFRVTMARNAKGELIDYYDMHAKINYKATAEAPPEIQLKDISDKSLVVSYEKLGFCTVEVSTGDMDWSMIKDAIVEFEYLAEPDKPDTRKEVRLAKDKPTGYWKCFTYGHDSKEYRYRVRYIYTDGDESTTNWSTDTRDKLIIDDIFIGRVKANFDVVIDRNTVESVKLEILYEDAAEGVKEEYSQWFNETGEYYWSIAKRENGTDRFQYRFLVEYKDDMIEETDWTKAESNAEIPVFQARRFKKVFILDAADLDWGKWRIVYATVKYEDFDHGYEVSEVFRLDEDNCFKEFTALAFDPEKNRFSYSLRYAKIGGGGVSIPEISVEDNLLLLEEPQEEEEPVD